MSGRVKRKKMRAESQVNRAPLGNFLPVQLKNDENTAVLLKEHKDKALRVGDGGVARCQDRADIIFCTENIIHAF